MKTKPDQNHIDNPGNYKVAWIEYKINQEDDVYIHGYPDRATKNIVEFLTGGPGVEDI